MSDSTVMDPLESLIGLGHLGAGVGHHVINAFSAIVSNAELLRLDPKLSMVTDPAALAETIIRTALDAATVARKLIDYTRPITSIESAQAAALPATLALDALAREVVDAECALERPGLVWESSIKPVPVVRGHATQIKTMLAHLLQNAEDALPASGGTIRVSTAMDNRGWVALEVQDTGAGMDMSILQHAVEPFFSTKPGHLGVGLSIANGIWRRHRGTLSIRSEAGHGTLVRLCIEPQDGSR
jgi:two-component system, NtrC family, sensor kinase